MSRSEERRRERRERRERWRTAAMWVGVLATLAAPFIKEVLIR